MKLLDEGIKVAKEFTEKTIANREEAPTSMKIIYDCAEKTKSAKLTYNTLYSRPHDPRYGTITIEREWFEEFKNVEETEEVKNQKENKYIEEFNYDERLEVFDFYREHKFNNYLYEEVLTLAK